MLFHGVLLVCFMRFFDNTVAWGCLMVLHLCSVGLFDGFYGHIVWCRNYLSIQMFLSEKNLCLLLKWV